MVTPGPPPFRPPNAEAAKNPDNGCALAGVVAAILFAIYLVAQCSSDNRGSEALQAMNTANAEMTNAIAAQAPPPVEPLSATGIGRGAAHYRIAFAAESFSGAMVYSQNCYDALSREFTWVRLDQCGGFDMLAVRAIDNATDFVPASEQDYFQSEAAATRYLAAATGAGQPPAEADQRLSQVQARAARERTPSPRRPPANDDDLANTVKSALDEPMDEVVGE